MLIGSIVLRVFITRTHRLIVLIQILGYCRILMNKRFRIMNNGINKLIIFLVSLVLFFFFTKVIDSRTCMFSDSALLFLENVVLYSKVLGFN